MKNPVTFRVIAFDLGANFGVARNSPTLHSVCKQLLGTRAHRLAQFDFLLSQMLGGSNKFDVAVYETPFARGRDATRSLWGMAGVLEARASAANIPVLDVAVPTIKKFATGNGRAFKRDMIKAAQRWGYKGTNEHEADAVCLLKYAEANLERVVKA